MNKASFQSSVLSTVFMIIVCTNCSASLQIADEKIPKHSFSLRCPKCQSIINNPMPAGPAEPAALAGGLPPEALREQYSPAPPYQSNAPVARVAPPEAPDMLRQLMELLQGRVADTDTRASQEIRRALICVTASRRTLLAKQLSERGYQIYLAENCRQAVDRMKEEQMHILLLDHDFALSENGFSYMTVEVQRMRPALRRRMLVVKIAAEARTLDYHAAFLQSVNLLVNVAELNMLPDAVERTLRHHNELYKDFYQALETVAI